MAFLAKIPRVGISKHGHFVASLFQVLQKVSYSDAIENFTSELLNRSQLKFGAKSQTPKGGDLYIVRKTTQQMLKEINSIYDSVLCVDVRTLQDDQLSTLFANAVAEKNRKDLTFLVNECMKWERLPTRQVNIDILEYFESTKQLENLDKYYAFCLSLDDNPFLLKIFQIKFYWAEGNTDKSLGLLADIHTQAKDTNCHTELIACKELFLTLIHDAVGKKSEAVLLKLIHLIESQTLEDASILEQVWNELFTSQWFSDQQLALNLFRRHACLRLRLSVQTNYNTFLLLREHNVDAVYRLVELLLSHEMMHECQKVLGLLFDYQFWRKDLRTCSEIIQTCISLDIPLDPNYGRKLVMLLLAPKQPPQSAIAAKARDGHKKPPTVEFKF